MSCSVLGNILHRDCRAQRFVRPFAAPWDMLRTNMQLSVVSGRIVNTNWQRIGMGNQSFPNEATKEELHWQWNNGLSTIHYERTRKEDPFLLDVGSDGRFTVRCEGKDKATPTVQFLQALDGPIALSIGPTGKEEVFRAPSLWQLAIAYPSQCKKHLFPLLDKLPGGRNCPRRPQ